MVLRKTRLIGVFLMFVSLSVPADEQNYSSGEQQNILIELYTSEGCNSCPPAEEYLNSLKQHAGLWRSYIPVAFHVNYWDYLGWRDRYADAAYGKRQAWYAKQRNLRTVYTPAFVVNGNAWRPGWINRQLPEKGDATAGELKVSINDQQLTASYAAMHSATEKLVLNIAVLGMGLVSHIKAGENKGRTAQHEFVVVGYKSLAGDNGLWSTQLPALHNRDAKQYAFAVWVSRPNDPAPLQAVGGMLSPVSKK